MIFEDSRAHFVYSDKTALILHPKGDCFTYFSKNGQKTRQLVKYAINNSAKEAGSGVLNKLILALQFYNTYCDVAVPIITRDELLATEEEGGYERITKFFKHVEASWPGVENLSEYAWLDEVNSSIHLRSTDDEEVAQVSLSSNGF